MPRLPSRPPSPSPSRTPRRRRSVVRSVTTRDVVALLLAALWCVAELAHACSAYFSSG